MQGPRFIYIYILLFKGKPEQKIANQFEVLPDFEPNSGHLCDGRRFLFGFADCIQADQALAEVACGWLDVVVSVDHPLQNKRGRGIQQRVVGTGEGNLFMPKTDLLTFGSVSVCRVWQLRIRHTMCQ